jgi:hypothetical protein
MGHTSVGTLLLLRLNSVRRANRTASGAPRGDSVGMESARLDPPVGDNYPVDVDDGVLGSSL